jgi:hypothetical protein
MASLAVAASAAEPCCAVTTVDARTQTVTAKDNATGRTFQFRVSNAAALASVKVGQAIHADFKTMRVSLEPDGGAPCCAVTNLSALAPVR